jgi:hypothetical protein
VLLRTTDVDAGKLDGEVGRGVNGTVIFVKVTLIGWTDVGCVLLPSDKYQQQPFDEHLQIKDDMDVRTIPCFFSGGWKE